jgi:hypothetical protein
MAAQTTALTLSSALNNYWRKIQGKLARGFSHGKRKEKQLFDSFASAEFPWSAKENTFPVDLNERYGIASIAESGAMAQASSVNAVEATVQAIHLNGRFSISDIVKYADRGQANQLKTQLLAQSQQKIDAIVEDFSDRLHGGTDGVLAITDSDFSGTSQSLTLKDGYGASDIDDAKYLASLFKPGDRVAFVAGGSDALIDANGFGVVTASNKSTGVLSVTTDGSVSYSTNGIRIVKANNIEGTTLTGGTDFGRGLVGFQTLLFATTVHGISGSTNPNWTVAYSTSAAGRFTFSKLARAKHEIDNDGGLTADCLMMSQGVERDVIAQERAGLQYADATGLTLDGDIKARGMQKVVTKNVPNGRVVVFSKAAINKWEILPTESMASWGDLLPRQDYAASVGRIDWFGNAVLKNRKGFAVFTNQTEL